MISKHFVRTVEIVGLLLIASHCPSAGACDNFDTARNAAYLPYIKGVVEEVTSAQKSNGGTPINAAIDGLSNKYVQYARTGDGNAIRKLIGLGLFTAFAAKHEPLDVTFRLTCESAKKHLPPRNVVDPLACAVIALDGSRRTNPANRSLAKEMIDLAESNLATDRDPAGAQRLFDAIAPVVSNCASP